MGSYLKSSSGEAKYLRVVEMTLSSDDHEERINSAVEPARAKKRN